jgi:hypothetical protein
VSAISQRLGVALLMLLASCHIVYSGTGRR